LQHHCTEVPLLCFSSDYNNLKSDVTICLQK